MLEYNEIRERKCILLDGEPYEVLSSHVFRKQQRKPVNATKLKHLITGSVKEHSFHVSDKAEEAELEKKPIKYLFTNKGQFWFCEASDPSKRFEIAESTLGAGAKFLKPNTLVDALIFDEKIFGVQLPIKQTFVVKEAPPGIKGDSSRAGMKQITLETGAVINAPLFVETGDKIVVNTETGDYVERA